MGLLVEKLSENCETKLGGTTKLQYSQNNRERGNLPNLFCVVLCAVLGTGRRWVAAVAADEYQPMRGRGDLQLCFAGGRNEKRRKNP